MLLSQNYKHHGYKLYIINYKHKHAVAVVYGDIVVWNAYEDALMIYCKTTYLRVHVIFALFARLLISQKMHARENNLYINLNILQFEGTFYDQ